MTNLTVVYCDHLKGPNFMHDNTNTYSKFWFSRSTTNVTILWIRSSIPMCEWVHFSIWSHKQVNSYWSTSKVFLLLQEPLTFTSSFPIIDLSPPKSKEQFSIATSTFFISKKHIAPKPLLYRCKIQNTGVWRHPLCKSCIHSLT